MDYTNSNIASFVNINKMDVRNYIIDNRIGYLIQNSQI